MFGNSTVTWEMKPDLKSESGLCCGFIMAFKQHKGQSDSSGEISHFSYIWFQVKPGPIIISEWKICIVQRVP